MAHILVIDDEKCVREFLSEILRTEGHVVDVIADGKECIDKIFDSSIEKYDLIITDIIMPEKEGIETIIEIRKHYPYMKIIAISGGGRIGPNVYLEMAWAIGANDILKKPFRLKDFLDMVNGILCSSRHYKQVRFPAENPRNPLHIDKAEKCENALAPGNATLKTIKHFMPVGSEN